MKKLSFYIIATISYCLILFGCQPTDQSKLKDEITSFSKHFLRIKPSEPTETQIAHINNIDSLLKKALDLLSSTEDSSTRDYFTASNLLKTAKDLVNKHFSPSTAPPQNNTPQKTLTIDQNNQTQTEITTTTIPKGL